MEWTHVYTIALAITAIALLATEKAHLTVIGVGLMVAVAAPGLIEIHDAVAGFANTAVVTVGALYVVGEGFLRTGAASILANKVLHRTGGRESTIVFLIMGMVAVLSAFVNNTLVVVTFMPVITSICRDTGLFPSRLLIPMSYASIVGGMCTLVGTSTNLLVSGVLDERALPEITMFELSLPGLILAGTAILYVGLIGRHFLPRIPSLAAQPGAADVREYVTEITIGERSPLVDSEIRSVGKNDSGKPGPSVAMVIQGEKVLRPPFDDQRIQTEDILVVSGKVDDLASLHHSPSHAGSETERYRPSTMSFFELALTPGSSAVGRKVKNVKLKARYGATVVGLLRNGDHLQARLTDLRLRTGDVLLAFGDEASRESIRQSDDYHLVEGVAEKIFNRPKAPTAIGIIAAVVALFVTGTVHPCTAALLGALGMIVSGCLTVSQAMRAVNWSILLFIAGTIALSQALYETGAADLLGSFLASALDGLGPVGLLAGIYVATIVLTETLSNNAVAVLMTPVAIATAEAAGVDYRPLVMAVAFGASSSFANPLGYQTNLLVFGPGGYRFRDFLRVGLPLDVMMAVLGVTVIPWFWPL